MITVVETDGTAGYLSPSTEHILGYDPKSSLAKTPHSGRCRLRDLYLRRRRPCTERYSLPLHDAVERRLFDTEPRPDVRRQCVGLRVQPRELASFIPTQSPTTGTAGRALKRFVDALAQNIFDGFDNAQLTLLSHSNLQSEDSWSSALL
jgi:hypothetical protein